MVRIHRDDRAPSIGNAGLSSTRIHKIEDIRMSASCRNAGPISIGVCNIEENLSFIGFSPNGYSMTIEGSIPASFHASVQTVLRPSVRPAGLLVRWSAGPLVRWFAARSGPDLARRGGPSGPPSGRSLAFFNLY